MPVEQKHIEPGEILEGRVQGVTNFGAFIELPGGKVGLVHISEIANTYVRDVKDYLQEGDTVTVKVLNVSDRKLALSIKAVQTAPPPVEKPIPEAPPPPRRTYHHYRQEPAEAPSLDDKIARFMKESEEKMQVLKQKNRFDTRKRSRY